MTRSLSMIAIVCLGLLVPGLLRAQTVVVDTNISLSPGAPIGAYMLTVFQDAAGTDPTSIWLDYDGTNVEVVSWNIDEESDWYLAFDNDPFSAQNIGGGLFTAIFTTDSPAGPIAVGPGDFILAVNTGQGFIGDDPNRDVYGWIRLSKSGPDLIDGGDAVAYDGWGGIFVGTTTPIPIAPVLSPGGVVAFGLLLLTGMVLAIHRRGLRGGA